MAHSLRLFASDTELSKKHDDHRPGNGALTSQWKPSVPRMRKRRLLVVVLALGILYLFFKNMPTTLAPMSERFDRRVPGQMINGLPLKGFGFSRSEPKPGHPTAPTNRKPPNDDAGDVGHFFDGSYLLEELATSLQSMSRNLRFSNHNRNVLFAAASLQSASRLIPMACEMSRWNRNVVHFAYMGRDDTSLADLKHINGVGVSCEVYWHDARPDFSQFSTDSRMHLAVETALGHMTVFMHPQVYICDDSAAEEIPFIKEYRTKAAKENKVLIELPRNAPEKLMWMTRLDSGSLSAWHNAYIDIIIQAPSGDSGPLIRLLRSISEADYFGVRYPHVSVEIPQDIDAPSLEYLNNIIWPPLPTDGSTHSSKLTFRRRISTVPQDPLEASIRTIESFYPTRPDFSHVLVLSPDVELSPMYFHYLYYHLLEYKYSFYNSGTPQFSGLAGISLATPTHHISSLAPFVPPAPIPPTTRKTTVQKLPLESTEATPFLWQAPSASATLYFGNKWLELHSFLSLRVSTPITPTMRQVPPTLPAFTEPLFELMKVRGYTVLYPNLLDSFIAIPHSEHKKIAPEFAHQPFSAPLSPNPQSPDSSIPTFVDPYLPPPPLATTPSPIVTGSKPLATSPLHLILPSLADLPELSSIPLLSYEGTPKHITEFIHLATAEAATFRFMTGSCPEDVNPLVVPNMADDLFCDPVDGEPGSGTRPPAPGFEAAQQGLIPGTGVSGPQVPSQGQDIMSSSARAQGHAAQVMWEPDGEPYWEEQIMVDGYPKRMKVDRLGNVIGEMPKNKNWDPERGREMDRDETAELQKEFKWHLERQRGKDKKEGVNEGKTAKAEKLSHVIEA